ncbi:MAG: sugar phosphate isomerase/epimerase family protein [Alistipes onderdonkii]|jgi:AP endonuclease, family 2|nr:sugar phosphate isomerase/epimerase family protein [Alistipes onderdonkii]MEE0850206.1 sugar phosphate isomerase/epimerase family protein [Alistipes onderdonkii]PWM67452.1 MAG: sugar phosphate isomerase/epimerase [Clostridiales bacterium]
MKRVLILMAAAFCAVVPVSAQRPEPGTTTALYKQASTEDFSRIRAAGIEWIEVALNQCYRGVPMEQIVPRIEAMKAMVDSAGLKVWSVHLPFSRTLDISAADDSLRRENVAFMAKMIRKSGLFSPQRLVLHPSSEPIADEQREQRIENAIASIRLLKQEADAIGAELCIENLPRTCLGNTPEELVRIVDAVPGVGICFDTNHYIGGTTGHFMDVAGRRIRTLHCSDFDFVNECHWLPTQGDIDWREFVSRLHDIGYDGVFMYEAIKDRSSQKRLSPEQVAASYAEIFNAIE